jgi:integrase
MPWYKDDKTDTYFFKVNYKDRDGKYKQILRRGFKSQREVKAAMAEVENEVNKGTFVKPSNTKYVDYMRDWLEDKKTNVKRRTLENYSILINKHILPERENTSGKKVGLGKLPLENITPRHIQDLYNYLSETGDLSDENIQKCHTLINESLKQAKAWKMIADNPAELVKRPTARKKEMQVWSLEESQQFLKVAKKDPFYIVFLLALTTGMRQGEILGLRWQDVNKENRIISVTQILNHDGKEFEAGAKTISGQRPIKLDEQTMKALEDHRKAALEKRMRNADVFEDKGLVVHTKLGGPVSPRNVNRSFKRLIDKAGVKEIRFHDLRHTHVTFLIKNRESSQAIAERLGWSDTRMIDKYAHIRPDIQEDVADAFGAMFFGRGVIQ